MAATTKFGGDFVHVHFLALGPKADAGEFGFEFFEHAGHDHRFDGAYVIDETFGVAAVRAGACEISFLQPEVSDLIVVREAEMAVNVT